MYKGLPEKGERADRHEERGRESRTSAVEFNIPYPDQKIKGRSQGWNSMEIRDTRDKRHPMDGDVTMDFFSVSCIFVIFYKYKWLDAN